jgi:hypothetical protein
VRVTGRHGVLVQELQNVRSYKSQPVPCQWHRTRDLFVIRNPERRQQLGGEDIRLVRNNHFQREFSKAFRDTRLWGRLKPDGLLLGWWSRRSSASRRRRLLCPPGSTRTSRAGPRMALDPGVVRRLCCDARMQVMAHGKDGGASGSEGRRAGPTDESSSPALRRCVPSSSTVCRRCPMADVPYLGPFPISDNWTSCSSG